ncbi:MAG: 50S ribosomal protein L10 [Clostridiales bacterium]|nr:50S ribosomal protein L10 [Clostridiales bacterium]
MASEKILAKKQEHIAELAESMSGDKSFVFVAARGLTVAQDTAMRKELREAGVTYKVIKNTTLKRVFEKLEVEGLDDIFEGPTAVAFCDEVTTAPKILCKYAEDIEVLQIKGGVISGKVASIDEIVALSKIPSTEVLYSQVVYGLLFPLTKLAMLVKAVAEKKEEGGEAPAAKEEAPAEAVAEEAPAEQEAPAAEEAPAEEAPAEEAAAEEAPAEEPAEAPAES